MPYCFVCQICLQSWLSAESISRRCPGLPTYTWPIDAQKPDYLVTSLELKILGFEQPHGPPLAYYRDEKYTPLYDERIAERKMQALPKP